MKLKPKLLIGMALISLLVAGLLVPQAGAAKRATIKVTWNVTGRATGPDTGAGKITSKQMGNATFTIKYKNGFEFGSATFKGGKLNWKGKSHYEGDESVGKWTVTGGTGKYKGASGGGTGRGPLRGPWTYKGKITY